jgi:hypothetical protein
MGYRWPFSVIEGCYHTYLGVLFLMVAFDWLESRSLKQFEAKIVTKLKPGIAGLEKTD